MPTPPAGTLPAGEPAPRPAADTAAPPRSSSLELCWELLAAISRLAGHEISATLDRSLIALGLHRTVEEVLLPAMREVGVRWSRGRCDREEEHLATTTLRSWLVQCGRAAPPRLEEPPVVLACGPLDQHTIALEAFHVLLSDAGFGCVNLGSQVPPTALATAVDTTSAQGVVLVSHLVKNRAAAVSALRAVEHSSAALFYAGAAFRTTASRKNVPGHYLGGNLSHAAAHVSATLRTSAGSVLPQVQ